MYLTIVVQTFQIFLLGKYELFWPGMLSGYLKGAVMKNNLIPFSPRNQDLFLSVHLSYFTHTPPFFFFSGKGKCYLEAFMHGPPERPCYLSLSFENLTQKCLSRENKQLHLILVGVGQFMFPWIHNFHLQKTEHLFGWSY